jgi:hypothetical protein
MNAIFQRLTQRRKETRLDAEKTEQIIAQIDVWEKASFSPFKESLEPFELKNNV